ncbi:MAG: carbonic anhydrase, partial [Actinomycetota bacterium]
PPRVGPPTPRVGPPTPRVGPPTPRVGPPAADTGPPTSRLTADVALRRLLDGNERFVTNRELNPDRGPELRLRLAEAQHPFAVILGCSDSRVPPEILFDEGLGDLFVIRNAGAIVDTTCLASVEYGVDHLGVSLVLVLGHERCGVITTAVAVAREGEEVRGHLWSLIDAVRPALETTNDRDGDVIDQAVCAHVKIQVECLRRADPIVSPAVKAGAIQIVGARYDIDRGQVELLT